ncbi:MAG: serine/threonine-protein kinase [Planctomycetota bacterium]
MDVELEQLLSEFIERRDRGEALTADAFCREHPHRGEQLRDALRAFESTSEMFPDRIATPQRIGRYEVLETLGRGGLGVVVRARDPESPDTDVALKLLQPGALVNARARERFRREGEALQRVSHPNVVGVREVGDDNGQPFLAMELIEGRSLADWIDDFRHTSSTELEARALPGSGSGMQRVLHAMIPLVEAVATLHGDGILHRDLKPQNVILRDDGTPVLVDFGLAGDDEVATMTRTGDVMGTLAYMPPEQARGERVDERADIYGLGAILYELVTLQRLHATADSVNLLQAVTQKGPRPGSHLPPDTPASLRRVLYRCLAFQPKNRYADVNDLLADLLALRESAPVRAAAAGPMERTHDWIRHNTRAALGVGVTGALLLVAAICAAFFQVAATRDAKFVRLGDEATIAWVRGAFDAARSHAIEMQDLRPDDPLPDFFLSEPAGATAGNAPVRAGYAQLREATALFAAREYPAAMAQAEAARRALPDWALPPVVISRIAYKMRDRDRAARELSIAVGLLPASAQIHHELATVLYRLRDHEGSIRSSREATERAPHVADYWIQLSKVCLRLSLQEEGLAAAQKAATLGSEGERSKGLQALGVFLDATGEHEKGLEILLDLYQRNPNSRNICFSVGLIYDRLEQHKKALEFYERSIEIKPTECEGRLSVANIYAGANRENCADCEAFFAANPEYLDFDKATDLCREALDIDHGNSTVVVKTLVDVMANMGKLDEAISWLQAERDQATRDQQIVNLQRGIQQANKLKAISQ